MKVALVHDYLTQRGGAERVVLSLTRAFPEAPVYTSLYDPDGTFPEFADVDVRTLPINRLPPLRRHHRLALPLLGPSFSRLKVKADVVICSSSGWAHGAQVEGRKIVYCHTPARWIYQPGRYLRGHAWPVRAAAGLIRTRLERRDQRAAASADLYLANSTVVAERIKSIYGVEAEIVPRRPRSRPTGRPQPVDGVEPGFVLCVSRLLAYKNVDAVVRAFAELPTERLVVAGGGPEERALGALAGANVTLTGRVSDDGLRWLYANCRDARRRVARGLRTDAARSSRRSASRRRRFAGAAFSTPSKRTSPVSSSTRPLRKRFARGYATCSRPNGTNAQFEPPQASSRKSTSSSGCVSWPERPQSSRGRTGSKSIPTRVASRL